MTRFLVFNIRANDSVSNWWPCWKDKDGLLWLSNLNGRKNGFTRPTVFKTKEEAKAAIKYTRDIAARSYPLWSQEYLIQPIEV